MAASSSTQDNDGPIDIYADNEDVVLTVDSIQRLGRVPSDLTDVFISEEPITVSSDQQQLAELNMCVCSVHHRTSMGFQDDPLMDSLIEYRHYGICCDGG